MPEPPLVAPAATVNALAPSVSGGALAFPAFNFNRHFNDAFSAGDTGGDSARSVSDSSAFATWY